jgi:hypothetical protein
LPNLLRAALVYALNFSLCIEVEDLETAIAHFQQVNLGMNLNKIQTASHEWEIYVYDPAGNRLILILILILILVLGRVLNLWKRV